MFNYKNSCIKCQDNLALFELFHKNTSLGNDNSHLFSENINRAFDNPTFIEKIREKTKKKGKKDKSILLKKSTPSTNSLVKSIQNRKSERHFSNRKISFKHFSEILLYSFGKSNNKSYTVPSAGGIYSIKLIVVINNVDNLERGLYEYDLRSESIIPIYLSNNIKYSMISSNLSMAMSCAFSIHFISNIEMLCYKYQDRGYRFANIECGHISQNMCLVSESMKISSLCSGGFLDKDFINYLNSVSHKNYGNSLLLYEMFFGYSKN